MSTIIFLWWVFVISVTLGLLLAAYKRTNVVPRRKSDGTLKRFAAYVLAAWVVKKAMSLGTRSGAGHQR